MSNEPDAGFTPQEISDQAKDNLTSFILVTLAYLRQSGQSPDDWVAFVGRTFAPGWDGTPDQPVKAIARAAALNHVSAGAELVSLTGDQDHGECVFTWPSQDMLDFTGLTRADVRPVHEIFRPITERLGLRYEWRDDGDQVTYTFSR